MAGAGGAEAWRVDDVDWAIIRLPPDWKREEGGCGPTKPEPTRYCGNADAAEAWSDGKGRKLLLGLELEGDCCGTSWKVRSTGDALEIVDAPPPARACSEMWMAERPCEFPGSYSIDVVGKIRGRNVVLNFGTGGRLSQEDLKVFRKIVESVRLK